MNKDLESTMRTLLADAVVLLGGDDSLLVTVWMEKYRLLLNALLLNALDTKEADDLDLALTRGAQIRQLNEEIAKLKKELAAEFAARILAEGKLLAATQKARFSP